MSKRQKTDQNELFTSLAKDFHELVSNKQQLKTSAEHFLNNIIDEITLGIVFDSHRKFKTDAFDLEANNDSEEEDDDESDIFLQHNLKKNQDCLCPNCSRTVAASRFAPHLEKCMGMRKSRNAARRVAVNNNNNSNNNSKDRDTTSFPGVPSDDEDDADWSSEKKRSNKKKDRNGGKKNRGTPKKTYEPEPVEPVNVDIEGDDEELSNFREMMHLQDQRSNLSSPAEGASSAKKREKSKKRSKKDSNSPCTSMSLD